MSEVLHPSFKAMPHGEGLGTHNAASAPQNPAPVIRSDPDMSGASAVGNEAGTGAGVPPAETLSEPGTWGGEYPTRTPDAVCPFPNTGPSLSHGGIRPDPGSLSVSLDADLDEEGDGTDDDHNEIPAPGGENATDRPGVSAVQGPSQDRTQAGVPVEVVGRESAQIAAESLESTSFKAMPHGEGLGTHNAGVAPAEEALTERGRPRTGGPEGNADEPGTAGSSSACEALPRSVSVSLDADLLAKVAAIRARAAETAE